jgi:hypothetical protein
MLHFVMTTRSKGRINGPTSANNGRYGALAVIAAMTCNVRVVLFSMTTLERRATTRAKAKAASNTPPKPKEGLNGAPDS